jgi:alpha-tubulin suppressor-like RCC1 family protein
MLVEGTEIIFLSIGNGSYTYNSSAISTINILDNPPTVSVTKTADADENGTTPVSGNFQFTRTGLLQPLTVYYNRSGTAEAGNNALTGSDYVPLSGIVSFASGVSVVNVPVNPYIDVRAEQPETVQVDIVAGPVAGAYVIGNAQATMTIVDAPPVDPPTFYPPTGGSVAVDIVQINSNADSTIYYTLDGNQPTTSSPSLQSGQLVRVPAGATLKAKATKAGMTPSEVSSGNWPGLARIAAGYTHSLYLNNQAELWVWGRGDTGQLGLGNGSDKDTPTLLSSFSNARAIAGGGFSGAAHSVAVKQDGTVWTWGNNFSGTPLTGQLGYSTTGFQTTPAQVPSFTGGLNVAAGGTHTVILKTDGTVWSMGSNYYGQLGAGLPTGTGNQSFTPLNSGLTSVVAVSAGWQHTLALKSDGTVWAWGLNVKGQLGDGSFTERNSPVQVSGLVDVVAVSAGEQASLALKKDGTVWGWGSNDSWQARGTSGTSATVPVQITQISKAIGISAGIIHASAVLTDGSVVCWGRNTDGACANPSGYDFVPPTSVSGVGGAYAIATGRHTLALLNSNEVWSWGSNGNGQLGNGPIPTSQNAAKSINAFTNDSDRDGLSDTIETQIGSNPNDSDTNDDGILDGDAYQIGSAFVTNTDIDGDGLSNFAELSQGLNPFSVDTDLDGVNDALDAYPLDPTRTTIPASNPSDHTPPQITITFPASGITAL